MVIMVLDLGGSAHTNGTSFPVVPNFAEKVEVAVDALSSKPVKPVDEAEFIGASQLVIDGVRDIRRAVLTNRVSTC